MTRGLIPRATAPSEAMSPTLKPASCRACGYTVISTAVLTATHFIIWYYESPPTERSKDATCYGAVCSHRISQSMVNICVLSHIRVRKHTGNRIGTYKRYTAITTYRTKASTSIEELQFSANLMRRVKSAATTRAPICVIILKSPLLGASAKFEQLLT